MEYLDTLAQMGIVKILWGMGALFVCLVAAKLLIQAFESSLVRMNNVPATMHSMLKSTMRVVLYFLSVMVAASVMGIPMTSFLALFSVIGLAVSLAIQGVLSNLAGGVIILVSKMFSLGDYIESDTISGTVKEIGILHTRLASPDGKLIYVPNSLLQSSRVINYTIIGERRLDLPVSASYDNAPEEVRAACMEVVNSLPAIKRDPEPQVVLENYGESAINYIVRVWIAADDFWPTRYALSEGLYNAFKHNGVQMTYPHMNVHLDQK